MKKKKDKKKVQPRGVLGNSRVFGFLKLGLNYYWRPRMTLEAPAIMIAKQKDINKLRQLA